MAVLMEDTSLEAERFLVKQWGRSTPERVRRLLTGAWNCGCRLACREVGNLAPFEVTLVQRPSPGTVGESLEVGGMQEIIHYTDPQSRGMRSQMLLDVFEIPHRKELVELRKGDHKKPEYAKIHPNQRVPALKHGDTIVIESGAISLYLADLFAEKMNTPKPGTPERARLYEWIFFFQTTLEPLAMKAFSPDKKEEAKKEIGDLLKSMTGRIKGPHILGELFSVVDVIVYCELGWYKMMGIYPDDQPAYDNFMEATKPHLKVPV